MSSPSAPGTPAWRARPGGAVALRRPIAAALPLDVLHVARIEDSHQRCAAHGLSRVARPDFEPLGAADLDLLRERHHRLYQHAAPVMEMLHEQIVDTHSMVLLTDVTGTILHTIGDDDFLARAFKVALQPGVNWSESSKGTNAVGTALIAEAPTLVHADEHYLHANHFLTCSAVPILDPRGSILGVLDVSGDQHGYHRHTMGLVQMSARMIENRWLADDHRDVLRLHFHARAEFIGTLKEGIVAVQSEGRIVGANRSALELLGMSGAALRKHTTASLWGISVEALIDRFRSPMATPVALQGGAGRSLYAVARFDWPSWFQVGTPRLAGVAASPAVAVPPAGVPERAGQGLARLATGDAQLGAVVDKVRRVLDRGIPLLVLGETGTGKELLARALHDDSARRDRPFVAVNCAAIPDTLIEAELFGYEEGAFTGARRKGAVGRIVQADGGTLFLDEIGDMPVALQARLLRVLQERQVTPLGGGRSVAVDVMLVCATHRNLREMIEQKAFREDLYYRLNGLSVRLPPLRERSDRLALVERILVELGAQRRVGLAPEVARLFEVYAWPGNVRQLHNVLRTALVMAAGDAQLRCEHLPDDFLEEARAALAVREAQPSPAAALPAASAAMPQAPAGPAGDAPAGALLQDLERQAIQDAVQAADGNISVAARRLGISRNTIYRRLRATSAR